MAFELEAYFGNEGARDYRTAMRVLHDFARRTKCPLGSDVIQWFATKNVELDAAMRAGRLGAAASTTLASGRVEVAPEVEQPFREAKKCSSTSTSEEA